MNNINHDSILSTTQTVISGDGKNFKVATDKKYLQIDIGKDDLGELIRSLEQRIMKLEAENER